MIDKDALRDFLVMIWLLFAVFWFTFGAPQMAAALGLSGV